MTKDNLNGLVLHDSENFLRVEDDKAIIKRVQHIEDSFLDNLADRRLASNNEKTGDFYLAAQIPTAVAESWMAEGFNIFDKNVDLKEILKRIRSLDMENLLATNKRLY
jgi:hypothetical protein